LPLTGSEIIVELGEKLSYICKIIKPSKIRENRGIEERKWDRRKRVFTDDSCGKGILKKSFSSYNGLFRGQALSRKKKDPSNQKGDKSY